MPKKFYPLKRGHMVTSRMGPRSGGHHWGTDFGWQGGSANLPVYAVQGGTVIKSGPASGFGKWVVIDHPAADGGGTTVYGHVDPEVSVGQRVEAGQRIAKINNGSNNGGTAPHLHLEWHRYVWSPPGPDRLDPLVMLEGAAYPAESAAPSFSSATGQFAADVDILTIYDSGKRDPKTVPWLVVHTFEDSTGDITADAMAKWQQKGRPAHEQGSYTLVIDKAGRIARENDDDYIPWSAARTGNRYGFHFCLAGRASWTRAQWLARETQLRSLARVLSHYSGQYGIPLARLTPDQVRQHVKGVCAHDDISKAFGESNHWDPGPNFPFDVVLTWARGDSEKQPVELDHDKERLYELPAVGGVSWFGGPGDPSMKPGARMGLTLEPGLEPRDPWYCAMRWGYTNWVNKGQFGLVPEGIPPGMSEQEKFRLKAELPRMRVKVTHLESGKAVVLRPADAGPQPPGRIIDVSEHVLHTIFGGKTDDKVRVEWAPDDTPLGPIGPSTTTGAPTVSTTKHYDVGGPGAERPEIGTAEAIFRILHESTFWLPRRSYEELHHKRESTDTVLGHSIDAASYGELALEILVRLADHLDVDIDDLLFPEDEETA